jgi:hypothetical protein
MDQLLFSGTIDKIYFLILLELVANLRKIRYNIDVTSELMYIASIILYLIKEANNMANFFNLTLDTTAPADAAIVINSGATYTTNQVVSLGITTSDTPTTGYQMKIWGDVDDTYSADIQTLETNSTWIAYSATQAAKLAATGGSKTVYCKIRDDVYNATSAVNDAIMFRTTGPANGAISIDSGATYAVTQAVTLGLTTDDVDTTGYEMLIWGAVDVTENANIQTLEANSTWIAFSATQAIKLSTGDGSKTIYAKLRDADDYATAQLSDSITLDTASPAVTITGPDVSKVSEQATKDTATFSFEVDTAFVEYKVKVVATSGAAHDSGTLIPTTAGSTHMSDTGSFPATTAIECTIKGTDLKTASAADGSKVVKVFAKDAAGNWSI